MHVGLINRVFRKVPFSVAQKVSRGFDRLCRYLQRVWNGAATRLFEAQVFQYGLSWIGPIDTCFTSGSPANQIEPAQPPVTGWHPRRGKHSIISRGALLSDIGHAIAAAILYYIGARIGFFLTFQPHAISTFWPPNAILVAMLLLTRPKHWWLLVAAVLPAHLAVELRSGVPWMMVLCWYVSNCTEALMAAWLVRRFIGSPVRFDSFRRMILFIVAGGFFAPFISSFIDAGFVTWLGFGTDGYWLAWRMRLFSNGLAVLLVVPVIIVAKAQLLDDLRSVTLKRALEGGCLAAGLVVSGTLLFEENRLPAIAVPILAYLPMPFLLWAAMRFGPAGTSSALLVMVVMSIWTVIHGRGPFSQMAPAQNVFSVQILLLVMSVPLMLLSAVRDERRNTSQALTESERRFRVIADAAPGMFWMSGVDKGCTFLSKGWVEFTGVSEKAQLGDAWTEAVHPEDLPACFEAYATAFDRREPFRAEYRLRQSNGEYGWVWDEGVPRYSADGTFLGYVGMAVDITVRKRIEAALAQSEKRFREVVESQPDLLCRYLPDMTLTLVNDAYCRFFGQSREQLLGESILPHIPRNHQARFKERIVSMLRKPRTVTVERKTMTSDGVERWHQWMIYPIFDGAGRVVEFQASGRDVTDWRHTEDSLRGTHRQIKDLAARLAHAEEEERRRIARELHDDFNQKLAAHAIALSNLQEDLDPGDGMVRQRLEKLQSEAVSLSDGIRLIAHELHPSRTEVAGLQGMLPSLCTEFSELTRLQIDLEVDVNKPLPEHVSLCCYRVVQESLRNIAKHAHAHKVLVHAQVVDEAIVLLIADDGVGVNEEQLKTARGLGITSMEERIQYLSGRFHISQRKTGGTLIAVEVPIV